MASQKESPDSPASLKSSSIPTWISGPLKSSRSWKVLFRCTLAGWVSFVILLPNASLRTLGTSGFFALLASVFIPPYLPVQLFIFMMSTLFLGLLFGWALGVAAMRAANEVRPDAYLQAVYTALQSSDLYQQNPTLATTAAVFNGDFLHRFSTVMYGVFLGVCVFIFALMRAYAPKLLISSIFGMIAVDIFCTIGPLFPTANYMILTSVLKATACYTAIGLVCTVFIFPESMNHATLNQITGQLGKVRELLVVQEEVLRDVPGRELAVRLRDMGRGVVKAQKQLLATSGMLGLEFSFGKWNGEDVKEVLEPLTGVVARTSGLQSFVAVASGTTPRVATDVSGSNGEAEASEPPSSSSSETADDSDNGESLDVRMLRELRAREQEEGLGIEVVLPLIRESTAGLRARSVEGLDAVTEYLDDVNHRRWPWARRKGAEGELSLEQAMDSAHEKLKAELDEFQETKRLQLVEPFLSHSSSASEAKQPRPLRSLYISYVFAANLIATAEATLSLLDRVRAKAARRPRSRLWAPRGLRAIGNVLRARGDPEDGAFGEETDPVPLRDEDVGGAKMEAGHGASGETVMRRDPDSRPPTNAFQRVMHGAHVFYRWLGAPETVFAFKTVVVTIALWIPAVVKHSAYFYYSQRGMWALIMAQTMMTVYAADQIFNLVVRLAGTFIGLVLGLATWYIGNARSTGNRYGAAAIVAVVLVPVMFLRVNAPQMYLQGLILAAATWVLIVGYSWIDGHLPQYITPGIGWSIAWRRWITVVIGAAAAFIVMMIPPTSARKAVRRKNAATIRMLAGVYASLVSRWISPASPSVSVAGGSEEKSKQEPDSGWAEETRERILEIAAAISATRELTRLARWEGGIRGKWPFELYERLVDVQAEMVPCLAQLSSALNSLSDKTRLELVRGTRVLHPHFITDVMSVFTAVSQALHTAEPLHQVLPETLLGRLLYHHHHHRRVRHVDRPNSGSRDDCEEEKEKEKAPDGDGLGTVHREEQLRSLEYMHYATAVVAVHQILKGLDEMHAIARELCGEVAMVGFGSWKAEYERGL